MLQIEVMLEVPLKIAQGLASGQLERVGGVIRKTTGKKEIVAWLREGGRIASNSEIAHGLVRSLLHRNLGAASTGASIVQGIVTANSQYRVANGLQIIRHRLTFVGALTALNIAVAGYTLLTLGQRIQKLERHVHNIFNELKKEQSVKLDAAVEYAEHVLESIKNHKDNAAFQLAPLLAAQPLIQSRTRLLADVDSLLNQNVLTAEQLIMAQQLLATAMQLDTLQVRCYLEAEQIDRASALLDQYKSYFKSRTRRLTQHWLGSRRRSLYFHESVSKEEFVQYLSIEEWLRDSNDLLFDLIMEHQSNFWDSKVTKALKPDSKTKKAVQKFGALLSQKETANQALPLHLLALEQVHQLIENFERFEGFALEIADLQRRNLLASSENRMSFARWNRLADNTEKGKLEDYGDYVCVVDTQELQKAEKVGW